MSHTDSSQLNLSKLTAEQRLKITQGIVNDLIRALNLGNYALIWRYFSDSYNSRFDADDFTELHQQLTEKYQTLESFEQISSTLDTDVLNEQWQISTKASVPLTLSLTLTPVKEFLAIDDFSIGELTAPGEHD